MGTSFHRLRIKQSSGALTSWHSDTIWGQLCWVIRDLYGEKALADILRRCREGFAPFVLSDAFPAGYLPVPAGGRFYELPPYGENKAQIMKYIDQTKIVNKLQFLTIERFITVISGKKIRVDEAVYAPHVITANQVHSSIDRERNTVFEDSLFLNQIQYAANDGMLDVYILLSDEFPILECFNVLAEQGIGRGVSRGYGAFSIESIDEVSFPHIENPNAYITLSHCTPAPDMPTDACYKLYIKTGKHGRERSQMGQPFKKTVIQFEPGAVFWGTPPSTRYCGTLVNGISFEYSDAVQCGLSVIVPACIVRE